MERQLQNEEQAVIQLYRANYGAINYYNRPRPNRSLHNRPVNNNDLLEFMNSNELTDIFNEQEVAFSVNLSLGFILFNHATAEYRYFHTSDNNARVLPQPVRISNREDFDRFMARLRDVDFLEHAAASRPASSWVVHRVMNVTVCEYHIQHHPIGHIHVNQQLNGVKNNSISY